MFSKGALISDLFPKKRPVTKVSPAVLDINDFSNINCPLKDILIEENRTADERDCRAVLNNLIDMCVESIEKENSEACILHLINMPNFESVYSGDVGFTTDEDREFYNQFVNISVDEIVNICSKTVGQNKCREWFSQRRCRISASSKAHKIKTMVRKKANELAVDFLCDKTINNKNLEFGIKNEKKAIEEYKKINKVQVYFVGVLISQSQPWLCASIDGVVVSDNCVTKIIEVKCVAKCINSPLFNIEKNKFEVDYLQKIDEKIYLKKTHQYYTQAQIQMYVSGMSKCDFFVWTPVDNLTVQIQKDEEFLRNCVPKLENFYFKHYLPALTQHLKNSSDDLDENTTNRKQILKIL